MADALHELLGGEQDGQRPRWLPHLSARPDKLQPAHPDVTTWSRLLGEGLLPKRCKARVWTLDARAARFEALGAGWKKQATEGETASTSAALDKADTDQAVVIAVACELPSQRDLPLSPADWLTREITQGRLSAVPSHELLSTIAAALRARGVPEPM